MMSGLGDIRLLRWRNFLSGIVLLFVIAMSYGDILDLTLVTNHPLLDLENQDDHVISAYIGDRPASIRDSITFERIEKGKALNEYTNVDNEGDNMRLYFNNTAGIKGIGTFRAVAEFGGVIYTTSTVVLLHNATIKPKDRTLTAYVGEDVSITVITDLNEASLRWRFNGTAIKDAKGDSNLGFFAETSLQAGVYQCFESGRRGDSEHAYMLLHIRSCPAGRWGLSCNQTCRECLNGGMCDAGSGDCVCPPGFKGSTCQEALGSNRFGQSGSFSCDPSVNDHGPGCRGKLFCLPDPFGCTCAAGYMGLNCTIECIPGTYGANCLQVCHCYGNNCAPDTGTCINGAKCQDGWTGINCQESAIPVSSQGNVVTTPPTTHEITTPSTTPVTTPATFTTPPSTPTYEIQIFNYTKVNNGEHTRLFCVVSPPLPSTNIGVINVNARGGDDGIGFVGTSSSSSTRTSWYQVQVGLDDGPRNFRCILHRPDGSSVSSDLAVSVYEPPSFNVFNSPIQDITSHSITLRWNPWVEGSDYGDGPVIGYRVYLSVNGQNNFIPASNDLITDSSFAIHNLTRDTEYYIRVAAVRPGPSGEGTYAPASSHRTLCSAPSEAPVLSVQSREQSSVTLGWELISRESWGCSALSQIEITVDSTVAPSGFPQTLPFDAGDRTATIRDLQDCTPYRISAAFRNKDELGISSDPISVSTSLIRPASVQGLQISPFKTQIEVNWDLQSNLCSPDYYIIRYGLYQMLACSSPEPTLNLTDLEVISPTTRYSSILGLDPYSRYKVSVIAVNGAGQSEETTGYADTLPGQPSFIANVRVDQERTSTTRIGFTWQPLTCRNVNGVFSYYYARIYKDGDRSLRAAGSTYLDDDISFSSVEFDELEPCTMYELNINAANRDVQISEGEDIRLSYASGVTGITFSSVGANAVSDQPALNVWWTVPSQCAVKVDYYKLSYQLISRQACSDVAVIDATVYYLNTTSTTSLVQKRISSLEYYATYSISIKAVIGGEESLPRFVTGRTSEGVPSPIQSVSYTSTAESLHFVWEEPSCENLHGALDDYEYDLYNLEGYHVRSSSTSRNDAVIQRLDACTQYRFRVRVATTSSRRSERVMVTAMTNISAPGAPYITQLTRYRYGMGNTGLTVTWQPPTSPRCQPTNYEIKYYLRRGDMCEPIQRSPRMKLAGAVNGSTFTYDIKELRANSEYRVFVIGNTTSGYGGSNSMEGITGYSYPTGPPTNIHSTSIRKRSIVFTWEQPECGYRNGPITSYTVVLSDSKGVVVHINNVSDSGAVGYEIFSLIPYSNYSISIRAWNHELAGEFGPEVWEQTAEAKPAAPEQVTLPSSDQESITVEWVSPDPPEGRIIRYYILYWETDDADATPSNVSIPCPMGDQCSDLEYKFSGKIPNLKSDTNYSVQVRAESIRGVGPKSPEPAIVRITSEGIPSDPQEVIITSSTKTSLKITWAKPKYPRGRIISYKLAYKVKGKPYDSTFRPGDDFTMKQLDGDTTRFVLSDLVPATHYEVYVVASTSKGEGESSEHVFEFTAPPPVEDLPKPSPPAIVMSPEGTPTIRFSDELESPYITHMLLAVEERLPVARRRRQQSEYGSYSENPSAYIAASISKDDLPIDFTIGDNNTYGIYHNAPLKDKAIYSIRTGVQSNVGGQKSTLFGDSSEFKTGPTGGGFSVVPVVVGVICALLLVILIVVGFLYYRKRKGKFSRLPSSILRPRRTPPVRGNRNQFNDNMPMRQVPSLSPGGTLANTSVDGLCDAEVNRDDGAIYANLQSEHNPHTPIPLDKLITYVAQKKASTDAGFKQDYESFPVGQLHPWDVAKKIENKQKNRYINIIAYDHSRVQLSLLDNDPHSDYINASFIDGYNYPRKYIAAQGPNVASVKDFWRMLWQEDCCKIVMLTNLVEGEKKKCEKYWPDKKMIYGKITVTMKNQEVNTHYTVRTFSVQFEDDIREVVQFHYTSWPDMGVPKYTTPLMNFIRTVKQHQTDSYGAIIVHCSAGVGRTGTFITLDTMLDQAEKENVIDVYNFIMGMRQNRVKMVQVAEQYQFIYDALLETFVCGDTSIAQDLYLQRYPSLLTPSPDTGSTLLQEQFERLDMFTIKPREDDHRTAKNQMNMHKNRYRDKIPTDKSRPYLITEVDDGTNYINASFLPGYTNKDMFLGTQTPLPHTVADFWRLVFDYKICTIIMINGLSSEDQSMAEYWPDASGSEVTHAPFTITLLNEEHYEEISCRTLELRSTTSKSRVQTVYQLQLTTWPMSSEICTSPISIVELHRRAMIWNDSRAKGTPILVHCKDGEGATGTFCALSSVIERLQVEKLVDVFQACKRLRAIRPGAVASLAQYEFIHSVLRLYLDSYDIYENYRT